jgi:hypothetical protein
MPHLRRESGLTRGAAMDQQRVDAEKLRKTLSEGCRVQSAANKIRLALGCPGSGKVILV